MSIYEELQLNQIGSKTLIKTSTSSKEKTRHIVLYICKAVITLLFCIVFVTLFSLFFGSENSSAGVVVLLTILVFRKADLGIHATQSGFVMLAIYSILIVGPHLANIVSPIYSMLINMVCILLITILGCHNLIMANHATLVLSYLLLFGNDVNGDIYLLRVLGLSIGGIWTAFILYHNHRQYQYKRNFLDIFHEFHLNSVRTKWQIQLALAISTAMFIGNLLHIPRTMWIGFASMSVLQPLSEDSKNRSKQRTFGTLAGGILFLILSILLPKEAYSIIGILGGLGVAFSATYGWQTVFNSLGAISIASNIYGITGAVLLRYLTNLYAVIFSFLFRNGFDMIFVSINKIIQSKLSNSRLCIHD